MKKRSFSYIGKTRKWFRLSLKDLASQAKITPEYLSMLEKKRSEPGISIALKLALALGLRIDDILNLYSGLERLLSEERPLFRLPHTIRNEQIIALVAGLNKPAALENEHYASAFGAEDNRSSLFLDLSQRIAQLEQTTPEYLVHQRAEFIPLEQRTLKVELPERLELGEAYSAMLEQQKLTAYAVSQKTGLSSYFITDLSMNRAEVSVVNLDLATKVIGISVDELIFVAYPQLSRIKWPFFVQALGGAKPYQNEETTRLLTSPATLRAFEQAPVYERARMMLAYKTWWLAEAQARQADEISATNKEVRVLTPAIFRLLELDT